MLWAEADRRGPLLAAPRALADRPVAAQGPAAAGLEGRIHAAEERLLAAVARVKGGVAEGALGPEVARVKALGGSLRAMAARLDQIDALLAAPEFDGERLAARRGDDDPRVAGVVGRLRHVERLEAMRARAAEDLERALLKVEEITAQVLLLELAGPKADVGGLLDEIADGVEGVAEALLAVG